MPYREEVQRLDRSLASLARAEAGLRLRLGQVLEVLGRGHHFELGFSSVAAYALEHCDRSVRWVEAARCLARRLEPLPELRRAMAFGSISWSMGELLARVAQPEDEARWIAAAESRTVRQMRAQVLQAKAVGEPDEAAPASGAQAIETTEAMDGEEVCTLTCTVDQEEAWLFEATRALLGQLGVHGADAQAEALLAEGQATLLAALPAGSLDLERLERVDTAQRSGLARSLARHELELAQRVLQFHRADGWRRLGYASEAQYASERLGLSRSSLAARRALALRLEKLPRVAEALGAGQVGVEAAVQVARVATPSTAAAWVERAQQRTIKHRREEVAAALVAVRWSGEADCPPPVDAEMVAFHELEQAVGSGAAWQPRPANDDSREREGTVRLSEPGSASRRAWLVMLGSLAEWLESGFQMSAACVGAPASHLASMGRVERRWRVSRANYAWWRGLEAQARRWLPSSTSWLKFLCLSIWGAWQHLLGTSVAYGHIYIRDRYRCSSPVCSRRDVTPHHLQFRSAGGGDEDDNVAAVCTWCHLFGVHGGRIRALGTAERIRWELGAAGCPCLVVHGRERVAA